LAIPVDVRPSQSLFGMDDSLLLAAVLSLLILGVAGMVLGAGRRAHHNH